MALTEPAATPGRADAPPPRESTTTADRLFPVRWPRLAAESALAATVAWGWTVISYRVWAMSPHVPLHDDRDARLITNLVKNTADQGWWITNPDLGYPAGQQLYDFPHGGETWQLLIVRAMAVFTRSPGLLMNAYFFLGSGLVAVAALLALRHLRFALGPALVAAVAMTVLPFRAAHGQYHLFRPSIWWVPLSVVVVLWVLHWRERFLRDPTPPGHRSPLQTLRWTVRHNLRRRRLVVFAAMVTLLGMAETMTTAFTLTLLGVTGLLAAARRRDLATLAVHGLAAVALAAVFFVGISSSVRFIAAQGRNPSAARRIPVEQEYFGLKISEMLLPGAAHRSPALAGPLSDIRATSRNPSEGGQSLGLLGAAGFIGAVAWVLTHGWGRRGHDTTSVADRGALRADVGVLVVVATLVATVSGGAIVLSVLGLAQVRVWNRISTIIAFCSLIFALTGLEAGWAAINRRLCRRSPSGAHPLAAAALIGVLVAAVVWDGAVVRFRANGGNRGIDYSADEARWEADRAYAAAIDAALPDGSAVFQLPIIRFPEALTPGRMSDYDHLRGWVHLPPGRLRWSYGAMRGRIEADWQLIVKDEMTEVEALPHLLGLGFDALWVDTWGYDDDGAALRPQLGLATGVEPMVSEDERTLVYDLRPLRRRLVAAGTTEAELARRAQARLSIDAGP